MKLLTTVVFVVLLSVSSFAQELIKVNGKVTDEEGAELIGVTIMEKGTLNGVVTDFDGKFILKLKGEESILSFSFVGFETQEVVVADDREFNISLPLDLKELEEVVVVGYGVQKKSNVLGSIAKIKTEDIAKMPVTSVAQALQGQASGVQIINNSGSPGAGVSIRIRGVGTVNNSSPLYVVDGVIADNIDFLSSGSVESIEVLKDAAANIYGARGANGVILITTKSGSKGKIKINFDYRNSQNEFAKEIPVLDSYDYRLLSFISMQQWTGAQLMIEQGKTDWFQENESINWMDDILQSGHTNNYNLNISGGGEKTTYFLGVNHFNDRGIIKTSSFDRNNLTFKTNTKISKNVSFGMKAFYSGSSTRVVNSGNNSSIFRLALTTPPLNRFDDQTGLPNRTPGIILESVKNTQDDNIFEINGNMQAKFFEKKLTFSSRYSYRNVNRNTSNHTDPDPFFETYYATSFQSEFSNGKQFLVELNQSINQSNKILWDNVLNYNTSINDHDIGLTLASSLESFESIFNRSISWSETQFINTSRYQSVGSLGERTEGGNTKWTAFGLISRGTYSYKGKYLIEASLRADGSSFFSKENRWGYFPSVMLGWNVADEEFMKGQSVLSLLKFRISAGSSGNNRIDNDSRFTIINNEMLYVLGPRFAETVVDGFAPQRLGNPDIKWEKTTSYNTGLDFQLFEGKIYGNLDSYLRYTSGMLLQVPIVSNSGMNNGGTYPFQNGGDVRNIGADIDLGYRSVIGDLEFDISANYSFYRNEILALGILNDPVLGGSVNAGTYSDMGFLTRSEVGNEIGAFYGYVSDGLISEDNPQNKTFGESGIRYGRLNFVDLNGDGQIDDKDKTIIGSPHPDFTYAFNLNFGYKNWSLSMFWQGVYGNDVYNLLKYDLNNFNLRNGDPTNIRRDLIGSLYNNWTYYEPGDFNFPEELLPYNIDPDAEPSILWGESIVKDNFENRASSYFIEDGSYLRLRDVSIAYEFPKEALSKIGLNTGRVYIGARNLLTFTNYSGFDPEIGTSSSISTGLGIDFGNFPQTKSYYFGISLGL